MAEPGDMPLIPPFHDTRCWYHALIGQMPSFDRLTVLLTVLHSFNITLLQFGIRFF